MSLSISSQIVCRSEERCFHRPRIAIVVVSDRGARSCPFPQIGALVLWRLEPAMWTDMHGGAALYAYVNGDIDPRCSPLSVFCWKNALRMAL